MSSSQLAIKVLQTKILDYRRTIRSLGFNKVVPQEDNIAFYEGQIRKLERAISVLEESDEA